MEDAVVAVAADLEGEAPVEAEAAARLGKLNHSVRPSKAKHVLSTAKWEGARGG